jgi:amidohydrolase
MRSDLKEKVQGIEQQLLAWRRDFHRFPEIAFQEQRTSQVLRSILEELGLEVTSMAKTGLLARLKGKPGGRCVALRADIDALPVQEEGDKEYVSQNPGAAHACGHDGHMAVVLGAAKILAQLKEFFVGEVVFLFQPSEERPPGGAKPMVEEGALRGVDAIFGLHFWQSLPTGKVGMVKGPMMAQTGDFDLTIKGKGGHGSMPQQTVDPIMVASQIVVSLQSVVSRSVDPLKPAVLSFGTIQGGTIYNIIPEQVSLSGTIRTFAPDVHDTVERRMREIVENTCLAFGATAELEYKRGYPAVVNHPDMVDFAAEVTERTLGAGRIMEIDPVMGGEDFAYFLQKVPGAFMFFGMGDGMSFPHHHPRFDMDEKALPEATLLLTSLTLEYLEKSP